MCAVFGLLDFKGALSPAERLRIIRALSKAAEIRGTDATGIAFVQGSGIQIQKAPKPARLLIAGKRGAVRIKVASLGSKPVEILDRQALPSLHLVSAAEDRLVYDHSGDRHNNDVIKNEKRREGYKNYLYFSINSTSSCLCMR